MKKLTQSFLTEAPMWVVFLTWSFFFMTLIYLCMYWLLPPTFSFYQTFTTAGTVSGLFWGVLASLLTYEIRKSIKFWAYSEEVEKLIDDTNLLDELYNIKNYEMNKLTNLSNASMHSTRVGYLKAILATKIKTIETLKVYGTNRT